MHPDTIRAIQIATIRRLIEMAADARADGPRRRAAAARALRDAARWRRALASGDPVAA